VERVRRQASRVLLLDDRDRLLLLRSGAADAGWWFTVGGGVEAGETGEQAAAREVREETGLVLAPGVLGPVVHRRRVCFPWGGRLLDQDEEFRVARVPAFTVNTGGFDAVERAGVTATRWWTLPELRGTRDRLAPPALPALVAAVLAGRGPG